MPLPATSTIGGSSTNTSLVLNLGRDATGAHQPLRVFAEHAEVSRTSMKTGRVPLNPAGLDVPYYDQACVHVQSSSSWARYIR